MKKEIEQLREQMRRKKIDWYLIPTADFHNSEYVHDYFKTREFFSGFTGSNGTLVVSATEAGLWTDGRYFIQAKQELEGSGIELFRMMEEGVPTIEAYLTQSVQEGQTLAFDGKVTEAAFGNYLEEILVCKKGKILYTEDPAKDLWSNRPKLPQNPIFALTDQVSGEKTESKLEKVRKQIKDAGANYLVISKLDDIMWLFNLRGSDIECNPVALSYAFVTEKEAFLFVQTKAVTEAVKQYAAASAISLKEYEAFFSFLEGYAYQGKVAVDKQNIDYALYKMLKKNAEIVSVVNPTEALKAVKNLVEQQNMREVYEKDSAVLTRFIYWLKHTGKDAGITEAEAAEYLDNLRRQTEGFLDFSFPTISAYQENAAMMHYQATKENAKKIKPEGSLLVDSGGQYMGGTTDVTRTIVLGAVSEQFKKHFTFVMTGMLHLMNAAFLYGCTGRNLDILARQPLWDIGIDYKCGTGHGIGYMLNVHEGPQGIRWRYDAKSQEAVLEDGMVISNEPGVYLAGEYGIRTENIMLCGKGVKNDEGQFLYFEPLTLVPIDREGIDVNLLQETDLRQINAYHDLVYRKISPYMNGKEKEWLREVTKEYTKKTE